LSFAANGLKSHKTNTNNTFSSLVVCPECLNSIQKISGIYRPIDTSKVVIQAAENPLGKEDLSS